VKHYKRSRGRVKEQKQRRKQRIHDHPVKAVNYPVELIDGNYSRFPVCFCNYYNAYLTLGLFNVHRCDQRNCDKLVKIHEE